MSIPKHFSASIGAYFAEYFSLELVNDTLTYRVSKLGGPIKEPEQHIPTAEQWQAFRRALDEIPVWNWDGEYASDRFADGAEWTVQIDFGDRAVKAQGSDSYPDNFGAFRAAVVRLLDGRSF